MHLSEAANKQALITATQNCTKTGIFQFKKRNDILSINVLSELGLGSEQGQAGYADYLALARRLFSLKQIKQIIVPQIPILQIPKRFHCKYTIPL